MKLRLAYPQKLVVIENKTVYLFENKLLSAPLDEVVNYYIGREAVLPQEIKAVAHDVIKALLGVDESIIPFFSAEVWRKVST
ncbi:hypothetical protein [Thermococcus sp.]